ncbi:MAG: hypothetical protein J4G13_16470 [Dehalococcoidia bacterium]|nr:hypothetical protein [Dehalococcoidia bacterium]
MSKRAPPLNYTQRLDRLVADIRDEYEEAERRGEEAERGGEEAATGEETPIRLLIEVLVLAGLELI